MIIKPKISIIIPVYNVEKYLIKCLESCINQTFKDIEIIVVNDCSPDNSDKIMKTYEEKYPDFIKCVYLKENIKLGGARNKGVELAKGEYILFVDSDDYIDKEMCGKLYNSAVSNDADMVIFDYFRVFDNNIIKQNSLVPTMKSLANISKRMIVDKYIAAIAWNKLTKKDIIKKYPFPEKMYYEDVAVTMTWVLNSKKINYLSEPLYYYICRENSIVNQLSSNNMSQIGDAILILMKNFEKENTFEKLYLEASKCIFKELFGFLIKYISVSNANHTKKFSYLINSIKEKIPDWEAIIKNMDILNNCQKNILYKFLSQESYIKYLYTNKFKDIEKMFVNNNVMLWGTGAFGKIILNYLSQFNKKPLYIIDSNTNLANTYIEDILITDFESIKDKCDVIIVAIKDYNVFEEIKERVNKISEDIKVIYFGDLFII